ALAEELLELRARLVHRGGIGRRIGPGARLEEVAEVRLRLVAHFLRGRLAAVLGDARVVVGAHAADVQLGVTPRALIEPPQWEAQRRERRAALPANEVVSHADSLLLAGRGSPLRCVRRALSLRRSARHSTPSTMRISRSAALPSARSACCYPGLSCAAMACATLSNSRRTAR